MSLNSSNKHSKLSIILFAAIFTVLVSGCATHRGTGAIAGGAIGAGIGTAIDGGGAEGAIIGGLLGVIIGSEIGRNLDRRDRRHVYDSLERSPTGRTSRWTNPDTGYEYAVTPREAYNGRRGQPCRDFVLTSDEYGNPVTGTACRRNDGSWAMVN